MKKIFIFLCVLVMFIGIVGCPSNDDNPATSTTSTLVSKPSTDTTDTVPVGGGGDNSAAVPEPATLILLGSGLVGLAGLGRKRFKK